ncbi:putative spermidine/putrescine transport system ATP-binding protein [Acidovorax temperans]|uniref:Putative spermidine/putrescine transport system ATP-binding protein n=1 Tax=Acidovorax temperans TaxID=80878 RepID=A0A543L1T5_9BURK|nr:ABC transporter ATP-binding protein [Acidovorax temperans]TQN01306.1 putative spermidine/putrescine transport system ATP-binding protein [Acidovorax temperans]
MTSAVSLRDVSCVFRSAGKTVNAVAGVDLEVRPGEFFTLLGPSGSGKTTCLRMIGGFTLPTSGTIAIHGQDVSLLPPYARPVNTVFQDYALFPHMTILENVAYSLMVRGVDSTTREKKAQQLLETVQLPEVGQRKPPQLSGGQRQRVALARALISEPQVLLLDEPLGALDLKLREQMQSELKSLQRKLGITFIFVTHDQHEALSMSDRIGVFNKGRLEQVATPAELYNRPATRFVAEFVGAANVLQGGDARRYAPAEALMIRPEQIDLELGPQAGNGAPRTRGTVREVQFFGSFWRVQVQPDQGGATLLVDLPVQGSTVTPEPGASAQLYWSDTAMHVIETATQA